MRNKLYERESNLEVIRKKKKGMRKKVTMRLMREKEGWEDRGQREEKKDEREMRVKGMREK